MTTSSTAAELTAARGSSSCASIAVEGPACSLGSLESGTFAANFDPTTGDYVMTNELVITIVSQVDKLPCLGAPGPTLPNLRTIDQTLNKDTDPEIELADLMVLDMRNFGFPSTGGASWMIGCVNGAFNPPGNRVYIQSLTGDRILHLEHAVERCPHPKQLGRSCRRAVAIRDLALLCLQHSESWW